MIGNNHWDAGQCATLACLLEATAPKAGNVHPGAQFHNMDFTDMLTSAVAIAPAMRQARATGVGVAVWNAVDRTHHAVGKNTNLGTVLLLAPLACTPKQTPLCVQPVLDQLTSLDAKLAYDAIRMVQPGGLGTVSTHDVAEEAPPNLIEAMRASADRDLVARQYANGFRDLSDVFLPWWLESFAEGWGLNDAIVYLQMRIMSQYADSLIGRKLGENAAHEAQRRAQGVLAAGTPVDSNYAVALREFDAWLRADGHARNPGTTADLIAAVLFAWLWCGDAGHETPDDRLKNALASPRTSRHTI